MSAANEGKIDPAVVAALYVEHGEELKRFLMGILRDSQLTHDVLQATFAKMVEKGHQTQEASRKAWLFRVAFNEAMAIRRRQVAAENAMRQLAWTRNAAHDAADELLMRVEVVEAVRAAMEQLPPEQQQVVRMRIYQEKTFAEISDELGIPLGTALGRMRSALAKLRTSLRRPEQGKR